MTNFYPDILSRKRKFLFQFKTFFFTLLILAIGLSACDDEASPVGMDILPPSDMVDIYLNDAIDIEGYTVYSDSSKGSNLVEAHLGSLNDPVFGTTRADFLAQFRLLEAFTDRNITIDSLIMRLVINDVVGVEGSSHVLEIYEINDRLYADSTYYSNMEFDLDPLALPLHRQQFQLYDSLEYIDFKLSSLFINRLFSDTAQLEHPQFYEEYFKGLYFKLEDSDEPGFLSLDLLSDFSRMDLYYHDSADISRVYYFVINESSARINRYEHDFSTADPDKQIPHLNEEVRDSLIYIQGLSGALGKIRFPELEQWRDSLPLSVNRARLEIQVSDDDATRDTYEPPAYLLLTYKDEEGDYQVVPDYNLSSSYYDGTLDEDSNVYTFNIIGFVQSYLEGNVQEPELYIGPGFGNTQRVLIGSNQNSQKMVFEMVYTKTR